MGAAIWGGILSGLIALVMIAGLLGADSWRDGELFLEPEVLALGAVALALSLAGFVVGLGALRRRDQSRPNALQLWAVSVSASTLAALLGVIWFFVVVISASSD